MNAKTEERALNALCAALCLFLVAIFSFQACSSDRRTTVEADNRDHFPPGLHRCSCGTELPPGHCPDGKEEGE